MAKVGFIGLGTMGSGMVMRLLKAGHQGRVHAQRDQCEKNKRRGFHPGSFFHSLFLSSSRFW